MKTTLQLLFLLFTFSFYGQITLEHSYYNDGGAFNNYPTSYIFFHNGAYYYYTLHALTNEVKIYDSGHNLEQTINLTIQNGYAIKTLFLMTDQLFNNDSQLEFIVVSYNQNAHLYNMSLFNESGQVLFDFGNKWEAFVLKIDDNTYKLMVTDSESPNNYDIYSLPGTLSLQQQIQYLRKPILFPVPATNRIRIGYKFEKPVNIIITDLSGKIVLSKVVGNKDDLSLDISGLSSGNYIYKIDNFIGKFIKK